MPNQQMPTRLLPHTLVLSITRTFWHPLARLLNSPNARANPTNHKTATFTLKRISQFSTWSTTDKFNANNHTYLRFQTSQLLPMHASRRCGAHSRRSGKPCQSPATKNGRCRLHGGKSTGAPKGNRNAWKHGNYSAREKARRMMMSILLRG